MEICKPVPSFCCVLGDTSCAWGARTRPQPAVRATGLLIARMCPDTFCFHCEELGHMTDSCPEEVNCCICHVARHMAADCSFSWNRRSSLLRSDTSDTPEQQPSQLSATSSQSSECSDVISSEQCSQSCNQWTQSSQPASKSRESSNAIQESTDSVSTTFTAVFGFSAISWSFVFFTTVFACSDQLITSLLEFFCTVQPWFPFTSSANRVVSSAVLTIYITVLVIPSNYLSFLLLLRNSECRALPLLLRPVIWLDSGFFGIFRLLASRSRLTCISWTANN